MGDRKARHMSARIRPRRGPGTAPGATRDRPDRASKGIQPIPLTLRARARARKHKFAPPSRIHFPVGQKEQTNLVIPTRVKQKLIHRYTNKNQTRENHPSQDENNPGGTNREQKSWLRVTRKSRDSRFTNKRCRSKILQTLQVLAGPENY